jgi:hypothetical protein
MVALSVAVASVDEGALGKRDCRFILCNTFLQFAWKFLGRAYCQSLKQLAGDMYKLPIIVCSGSKEVPRGCY